MSAVITGDYRKLRAAYEDATRGHITSPSSSISTPEERVARLNEQIKEICRPVVDKMAAIEARLKAVEQKPFVWRRAKKIESLQREVAMVIAEANTVYGKIIQNLVQKKTTALKDMKAHKKGQDALREMIDYVRDNKKQHQHNLRERASLITQMVETIERLGSSDWAAAIRAVATPADQVDLIVQFNRQMQGIYAGAKNTWVAPYIYAYAPDAMQAITEMTEQVARLKSVHQSVKAYEVKVGEIAARESVRVVLAQKHDQLRNDLDLTLAAAEGNIKPTHAVMRAAVRAVTHESQQPAILNLSDALKVAERIVQLKRTLAGLEQSQKAAGMMTTGSDAAAVLDTVHSFGTSASSTSLLPRAEGSTTSFSSSSLSSNSSSSSLWSSAKRK